MDEIWDWNCRTYGPDHARDYINLLKSEVKKLQTTYRLGKPVKGLPAMQYVTIRRTRRGHGQIAVYEVTEGRVHVLDFFHTAQD